MTLFFGRRTPYTERGIKRKRCSRCGEQAVFQWNCCANGNWWVPLCAACDIAVNKLVLEFFRIPNAAALLDRYRNKVRAAPVDS